MKSALVTGSNGFIGRYLVKALEKKGVKVIKFSRSNNLDVNNIQDVNKQPKVDVVFHLAAVSGYKDCNSNTRLAYQINVGGTANLLNYCRYSHAKLLLPSTYVYDAPYDKYKVETDAVKPMTHYSFTKYLAEELCRFYSRIFNVDTLIMRTGNVYGAGQSEIYLLPIIAQHLKNNQTLNLTLPNIERSFIYIDDLVNTYLKLAEAKTIPGDVFNVSTGKARTIAELLKMIQQITGKALKVKYSGKGRPNEISLNRLNNSKITAFLNWPVKTRLINGLIKLKRSQYF